MARLQELIIRLGMASVGDLNRAIFAHPDSGLLDALEQAFGAEKANSIRSQISSVTKTPILPDEELRIDDSVLSDISALELAPLVMKYKAIPLRRVEENGAVAIMLAMADPMIDEARHAYSQLYRIPVRAYMARERAIMNAYALTSAKVSLAARREASEHSDSHLPSFAKHVEDPEVRKAIQQLTATAVKHNASLVEIDTGHAFTRAQFTFADGLSSSVEISVSPALVIASLLRRGQVVFEDPTMIRASSRVRFKSVSVDFSVECLRETRASNSIPDGVAPELWGAKVSLRNFTIDNPDNPVFWESMREGAADALLELMECDSGLFLVVGGRQFSREFALRALRESYPDLIVGDISSGLADRKDWFQQAGDHRVALGVDCADTFELLRQLGQVPTEQLSMVKGIFAFQQVPRNCSFCARHAVPETELLVKIPAGINLTSKDFRVSDGCTICDNKGTLGSVGISAVLDFNGYAGRVLRTGGNTAAIFEALAKDCFTPLLEDGLHAAGAGKVKLSVVFQEVAAPPEEYLHARETTLRGEVAPEAAFAKSDSSEERQHELRFSDDDLTLREPSDEQPSEPVKRATPARESSFEPLRGRAAFMARPQETAPKALSDDDDDWLVPKMVEDGPPPVIEKRTMKKAAAQALLLVIDDDADQRSILRRVFEIAGYRVEVAADGIDGIVSAVRLVPQLIIVDFMMPELDGRETIRRLKTGPTTGTIPIVALTAYADPDVELGLLQAGADDFCPKSVSKQVLLKRVERLVSRMSL
ncbi:MAG: response regulator [Bdellovibrionota bacterium]